jgi:hypothetical protein
VDPCCQSCQQSLPNEANFAPIPHIIGGLHPAKRTDFGPPTPPKIERPALLEQEPRWNRSEVMSIRKQPLQTARTKFTERTQFRLNPPHCKRPARRQKWRAQSSLIGPPADHRTYLLSVVWDSSWPRWKQTRVLVPARSRDRNVRERPADNSGNIHPPNHFDGGRYPV